MNMSKRTLKYHLRSADQLFFLHIPKAAGTTFYSILTRYFPEEQVLPANDGRIPYFKYVGVQGLQKFRLLRAHHDYTVYPFLPRRPVFITFLRDPILRLISHYRFIQREPTNQFHEIVVNQRMTLTDFVAEPEIRRRVVNRQVRQIAGALTLKSEARDLSGDDLLAIAKVRLQEFAYFGLAERFEDSLRLLCYTFGWDPVHEYTLYNVAPHPSNKDDLTQEELEAAQRVNHLDLALYQYAEELFQVRMDQMAIEMSVKPTDSPHSGWSINAPKPTEEIRAVPEGRSPWLIAKLGRLRRALIPEGSRIEEWYLRLRKRLFDW